MIRIRKAEWKDIDVMIRHRWMYMYLVNENYLL